MPKGNMVACLIAAAFVAAPAMAQDAPAERKIPPAGADAARPDTTKAAPPKADATSQKPGATTGAETGRKPDAASRAEADKADSRTETRQRAAGAPGSVKYITDNRSGLWRASKLEGVDIYNDANEKIGDIDEVLLDKDGKVEAVVIGVGGFLGIGERKVAVAFDALQWQMTEDVRAAADRTRTPSTTGAVRDDARAPARGEAVREPAERRPDAASGSAAVQNRGDRADRQVRDAPARAILAGATKDMLKNAPEFKFGD